MQGHHELIEHYHKSASIQIQNYDYIQYPLRSC